VDKAPGKLREPTACPQCGAVFHKGRWTWDKIPSHAHEALCPACRSINENLASGVLTIRGDYAAAHRQEILNLARNEEKTAKQEHPLSRIIGIKEEDKTITVSTTDIHLARRIGEALHNAHQGDIALQYSKNEQFLRAEWTRET
jgi:NMD protein affecting ribosome stability and mRNA decay